MGVVHPAFTVPAKPEQLVAKLQEVLPVQVIDSEEDYQLIELFESTDDNRTSIKAMIYPFGQECELHIAVPSPILSVVRRIVKDIGGYECFPAEIAHKEKVSLVERRRWTAYRKRYIEPFEEAKE